MRSDVITSYNGRKIRVQVEHEGNETEEEMKIKADMVLQRTYADRRVNEHIFKEKEGNNLIDECRSEDFGGVEVLCWDLT